MKRMRASLKWIGVSASAFLLCGWIGTFWSAFGYQAGTVCVDLSVGCIELTIYPKEVPTQGGFAAWQPYEAYWMPRLIHGRFLTSRATHLFIPVWMPLLLVGAPTILAFKHDPRLAPGHCQTCGYDVSHVNSDRCSECGTAVKKNEQKL